MTTFGFEAAFGYAAFGSFGSPTVTVEYRDVDAESGTDTLIGTMTVPLRQPDLANNVGARLVAFQSDVPFNTVNIVSATGYASGPGWSDHLLLSQFRYKIYEEPPPAPPVNTPASSTWSLALLGGLGLALWATRRRTAVA